MRGSMVDGKCSSSAAAASKLRRISLRSTRGLRRKRLNTGLGSGQEDRKAEFICVVRTIPVCVVHGGDVHLARSELRVRNSDEAVFAFLNGCHQTRLAFEHRIKRNSAERGRYQSVC